jgi:hypothetical protein
MSEILSRDRGTIRAVWIGERITQLVTTLYKSLSHTDWCSQSRSSLLCFVTSSNSGHSSASSQAGGHLTPTSYSSNYRLNTMAAGPPYTASAQIA